MAYSAAKLKSSGDRESPYFRPFCIGNLSDKCLPIRTLLYVSFKHPGKPGGTEIEWNTSAFGLC
jgi:hypothetical protein